MTRNVDPTVALVAIPALAVGRALFGAQFARELWIEPDDLDDRLATVATQLFDALRPGVDGPAQTREARARGAPGDRRGVDERDNRRRHQPKPARLRLRADRGLRAAPLLAGPDRLEHARIQQRRRVAELSAFGDVTQQPAHDLSAAGLGHLWDHVDLPRTSDR